MDERDIRIAQDVAKNPRLNPLGATASQILTAMNLGIPLKNVMEIMDEWERVAAAVCRVKRDDSAVTLMGRYIN